MVAWDSSVRHGYGLGKAEDDTRSPSNTRIAQQHNPFDAARDEAPV